MKYLFLVLLFGTCLFADVRSNDKKLVMLFVKLEHCQWCEKMEKEVFEDKETNATLQKEFIIKKVLYGKDSLPSFIKPQHFPTTYVISADGTKVIDSLAGYREKEKFLKFFSGASNLEFEEDDL
jgi:thioredoxin-related protein